MAIACPSIAQYTLRGTVIDTAKVPLPGVNVVLKGTTNGTVTDANGKYEITSVPGGTVGVICSFVGMITEERTVNVAGDMILDVMMTPDTEELQEVVLHATRATSATPVAYVNLNTPEIQKQNFGQDLPMLLNWTPSVVTTSDAGAGIGYTGIRIRGSDATRVNVTINGIPYNDSESQSTFWVDIPDFASSTKSIQVQRGVGTSSNGAGAFGASMNLDTRENTDHKDAVSYAEATLGAGSFGSQRYTLRGGVTLGTVFLEGKFSKIKSDGYIERASSDLSSYYFRAYTNGTRLSVQALAFGGAEKTYQAWYGVDEATLQTNRRMNLAGAIYDTLGNVSRYYANQVDDYRQDHGQLHLGYKLGDWGLNVSLHGTYGRGFYEEYQQNDTLAKKGLPDFNGMVTTDMVVRKWLENYFYGFTFAFNYSGKKSAVIIGGASSWYEPARHFGEIIWTAEPGAAPPGYRYYSGLSDKGDRNVYVKWNYKWNSKLNSFIDLQYRGVNYVTSGIQEDLSPYSIDDRFDFFNPKVGLIYQLDEKNQLYASYSIANREPNRSDYLEGTTKPRSERLYNLEAGLKRKSKGYALELNYFLMQYNDQLVQTGALDPAGYPIRANVGKSFRTGIEASAIVKLTETWSWNINATGSVNRNQEVMEGGVPVTGNTQIILSPSWIAGSQLAWRPVKGFEATWLSKYVGKQYLDNTENESVSLPAYWINDLRFSYEIRPSGFKAISWSLLLNNVMDVMYSSNGGNYDGLPYFYPQAGRNFMAMMTIRI